MATTAILMGMLAAGTIAPASVALASDRPMGCYSRTYDAAHLHDKPGQHVRRLWLYVGVSPYNSAETIFGMHVWVRGKLQIWRAGGLCTPTPGGWNCRPDTDGASELVITSNGGALRLSNPGKLKVIDDVTGPDLNDMLLGGPGDSVFLLHPAPALVCKGSHS